MLKCQKKGKKRGIIYVKFLKKTVKTALKVLK